jgi:glycogen debranching enzyme
MTPLTSWRTPLVVSALCAALGCPAPLAAQEPSATPRALGELSWSSDSTGPVRFLAAHGRRAAVFGYSDTGLESWVYPVQVLSSYRVAFRPQGSSSEIDGPSILRRVSYSPQAVTRVYAGADFVVHETLFVPLDAPGAIISYEVEGAAAVDVVIRFVPVLDLMWPAGIGGQETAWNPAASAYLLSEPTQRFAASVGSPDVVAHDDTPNATRRAGRPAGLGFTIRPPAGSHTARLVIAAGSGRAAESAAAGNQLLKESAALERAAGDHYLDMLADGLQIETPDATINRALTWAQVALDQAWVCNPDLGCGLVAGYGPSRKARRPQYDWFFAGDGMVGIRALLATGRYPRARAELEFILKYRDAQTGMIWHELVQSAASLNWRNYPYMFVHVDLSFDFLNTVADYYSTTADLRFIQRNWGALEGAYRYCRTLLDPHDGLPRIPRDKQGNNEQDELSDDLSLSASWVSASRSFAALAAATGHAAAAAAARAASEQASRAITRRYWDERGHFWISAYTRAGSPVTDHDTRPAGALDETLFSPQQRDAVLDELASAEFQADWGTRSKAAGAASYDPNSYAGGSVWGLGSAGMAAAFWAAHRPGTAAPIWGALVPWAALDSLGHMHEVLAGDYYHEELESVPEQTWSSAGFLSSTVTGLLGLQVDGAARRVSLAPHLPPAWNFVTLRHVRVADADLTLRMSQSADAIRLQTDNDGEPVEMSFAPQLPLGALPLTAQLGERTIGVSLERHAQDAHARVQFSVPHGSASLTLPYRGGVAVMPSLPAPAIGEPSEAIKIVRTSLAGQELTIEFDQATARSSSLELRTPWKIAGVQGAAMESIAPTWYRLTVGAPPAPAAAHTYRRGKLAVTFVSPD